MEKFVTKMNVTFVDYCSNAKGWKLEWLKTKLVGNDSTFSTFTRCVRWHVQQPVHPHLLLIPLRTCAEHGGIHPVQNSVIGYKSRGCIRQFNSHFFAQSDGDGSFGSIRHTKAIRIDLFEQVLDDSA